MYFLDSSHVLHVAKSGNDGNSGKAGQYPVNLANDAKLTIGSAITAAASGDTIILWPGDYDENVSFGSKALTLIGTSRNKSRVIPASGSGIVLADNSVMFNLAVEAITTGAKGVDLEAKTNCVIENCDIYGGYDGLYGYTCQELFLRGCRIRGKYDGANLSGAKRLLVEGCIFIADGTYGATVDCRAVFGGGVGVYNDCLFLAERNDTSSKMIGAVYCSANARAAFKNCIFKATAGSGHTGQACGILVNGSSAAVALQNCLVKSSSENATTGPYDLWQANGTLVVANCFYETTGGTITQGGAGWAEALNGEVADAIADDKLDQAAKILLNKAVQNKSTGAISYYDDDGETVILTHTPADGSASITRTPS
jgi:hypothetical protein